MFTLRQCAVSMSMLDPTTGRTTSSVGSPRRRVVVYQEILAYLLPIGRTSR
jgi:hypothetical protein